MKQKEFEKKFVNKIIHGDCLKVMKEWPDNCVDLVVTSPPYGQLREYKGFVLDWKKTISRICTLLTTGGVCVWICGDETIGGGESGLPLRQALQFQKEGLLIHDTMIYEKSGIPFPESTRYNQTWEYMFVFSKGKPKEINLIQQPTLLDSRKKSFGSSSSRQSDGTNLKHKYTTGKESRLRTNIWKYAVGFGHSALDLSSHSHPAIFPEQLASDHIVSWSNNESIILDPLCGSGTTCVAAKTLGRRYIGIDISEEYCEISRMRIKGLKTGISISQQKQGFKGLLG